MQIDGSVALVTGANRGIGEQFARSLLERGASKVYAGARDVSSIHLEGVHPIPLDVSRPDQVHRAAELARDVTLLVNNAGIASLQPVLTGDLAAIRRDVEINVFGPLLVTRAFADILIANGGGAVIDVLSAASWYAVPGNAAYSVSKAAAWNLTNAFRVELEDHGVQVLGTHVGLVDTDMSDGWDFDKISKEAFVDRTLNALEAGEIEVVVDEFTRRVKASLAGPPQTPAL